jgi:Flp pilus assembly protein TadB
MIVDAFFYSVSGGMLSALGLMLCSQVVQKAWKWVDDDRSAVDNYVCQVMGKIIGANNTNGMVDMVPGIIIVSGAFIGFLVFLYQYCLLAAIVLSVIIGGLFLARSVRRLHKKVDNHLANHK